MQPTKKKLVSVKDKLDGNEIDMSMLELTEVPVKELAAVSRGTILDLSNNQIISLPVAFPTLTHLIKLDLSKNKLKELPTNFGDLFRLRQLDLYSNELQRLPVSFCQLKELKWLDLKNNPLVPTLAEAAGDCLDQKGCQEAAKKVVKLMTVVHMELQKKRNKEQEEIKSQHNEEERMKEKLRLQKKLEKDRRRAETAKQSASVLKSEIKAFQNKPTSDIKINHTPQQPKHTQSKTQARSFCGNVFVWTFGMLLLMALSIAVVLTLNWEGPFTVANTQAVAHRSIQNAIRFSDDMKIQMTPYVKDMKKQWDSFLRFLIENSRNVLGVAYDKMTYYTNILHKHFAVVWPIVNNRCYEFVSVLGKYIMNYWEMICRETPIYYETITEKINQLFK